jgi:hypothetical protein
MESGFAEIRSELLDVHNAIRELSDEDILHAQASILEPPFRGMDRLAAMEIKDEVLTEILASAELEPVLSSISRLRNIYGLRLEIEQAHELLASPDPWARLREFTFYENYLQLAAMEQQGAGLEVEDRIVFLGSGPLPLSLILLCSRYGLQGIGIERECSFVELSRQVVEHLSLAKTITIMSGDHFALPLKEECQLLMVAAMARPKEEIFQHLARSLPAGSLVSFRLYEKGLRRLLDRDGEFILPPEFSNYCRIPPQPPVNNTVVVVKR